MKKLSFLFLGLVERMNFPVQYNGYFVVGQYFQNVPCQFLFIPGQFQTAAIAVLLVVDLFKIEFHTAAFDDALAFFIGCLHSRVDMLDFNLIAILFDQQVIAPFEIPVT